MSSAPLDLLEAVSRIAADVAASPAVVLVLGRPGRGKSTLTRALGERLERESGASLLALDPGQPSLGPPAAFALSSPFSLAFVGSTDPMAVRLTALGELLRLVRIFERARPGAPLVIDACGLVANAIGREWAIRQAEASSATHVVLVEREAELEPLARIFGARRALRLVRVRSADEAAAGSSNVRRRARGERLLAWLEGASERRLSLASTPVLGAPERGLGALDWKGRLVGLLDRDGATLSVGLALEASESELSLRAPAFEGEPAALRVGDAAWDETMKTVGRRPFLEAQEKPRAAAFAIREKPAYHVEPFAVPGDDRSKRAPGFQVHLANGLFGDPLVHVRPLRDKDGILLDLGRASSLPVKLLHRIGLVLLSHAHVDHFFGFDELLRALLGSPREVVLVGPEGIAAKIASRIGGYSWNLIESDSAYGITVSRAGQLSVRAQGAKRPSEATRISSRSSSFPGAGRASSRSGRPRAASSTRASASPCAPFLSGTGTSSRSPTRSRRGSGSRCGPRR
ncbi:hypothetical protein HY251_00995 [bacterium]|nr:hypothetical protein [bacterium]